MMVPNLTLIYDRKGQATKTRPAVVELRITADKARKYISTGVKLLPKEWSNGSVVGRKDWKEVNDQLQVFKKRCSEIITKMMDDGNLEIDAVPRLLKASMMQGKTFIEYAKEQAEVKYRKVSKGTKRNYEVVFSFLEDWRGIVYFSDLTESNITKMDKELERRGLKECSRWNYHNKVQSFILQAINDEIIKSNPYMRLNIKKGNEDGLTRVLTPAEFHRFENCVIPTESLKRVRDLFVFQTYTMMGYSDLAAFDYKLCKKVKGQLVYSNNRIKTTKPFTFMLMEPALNILKKYKYKLPIISNVKYNYYLKAAVLFAQIDKPVSSHWARHTGATMLLNEGKVSIDVISKILGDTIRETERTYAKMMDETIVETMANYQREKILSFK